MSVSGNNFLVVDDHPVLRQGVVSILGRNFEGATVREAANVKEAIAAVRKQKPDAVIVDPNLGSVDAKSSLAQLSEGVDAPLVMFASRADARTLADALRVGARACVRKDSPAEVLAEAIVAAQEGKYFIDPGFSQDLEGSTLNESGLLTERQSEILQLYADGTHTERVAEELGLSTETVRTHTKRILAKLNANTRTHAVAIALRERAIE